MYNFPKTVKFSLEGLHFLNCCLQHDVKNRMSWENLSKHSYLLCDWTKIKPEEENLFVSYHKSDSDVLVDPRKMDDKDIIKLSTRDPTYFVKTYESTINKAFGEILPDQSQLNPENEEEKKDSEKVENADQ